MKQFPYSLIAEKNVLQSQNPWVTLIQIDLTDSILLSITDNHESVSYDGVTYSPVPFKIEPASTGTKGELESVNVSLSNVNRALSAFFETYDLRARRVQLIGVNRNMLVPVGNTLLQTEALDHAEWTKTNCTIGANVTTAPDGTMTADKIQETAVTGFHGINNATPASIPPFTEVVVSAYFKAAERSQCHVTCESPDKGFWAEFDLAGGRAFDPPEPDGFHWGEEGVGNNPIHDWLYLESGIIPLENGWFRCWCRGRTGTQSSPADTFCYFRPQIVFTQNSYTGILNNGVYMWGPQLTIGPLLLPYQSTAGSALLEDAVLYDETYEIGSYIVNAQAAQITLEHPRVLQQQFPSGRFMKDYCRWIYKDPLTCKYAGGLPTCDHILGGTNGCRVHGNSLNFGGFPNMPSATGTRL